MAASGTARRTVAVVTVVLSMAATLSGPGCRPASEPALLGVSCPNKEASVFVDGRFVGTVKLLAERFLVLEPGTHRVEVRLPGHYTRYRVLRLKRGQVGILKLRLLPELPWEPRGMAHRRARPTLGPRRP